MFFECTLLRQTAKAGVFHIGQTMELLVWARNPLIQSEFCILRLYSIHENDKCGVTKGEIIPYQSLLNEGRNKL